MKILVSVSILLICATFVCPLEILDHLKSSATSFHQQIHTQVYVARGRVASVTENALPTELSLFELAVNDIFKDLATIEESFNFVPLECQERMPSTPDDVRNNTEADFHTCARNFFNELVDAQTAAQGFFAIMYGKAAERSLEALEKISRTRINPLTDSVASTISEIYEEYNQNRLEWDNGEAMELAMEQYVYQDKLESVKINLKNCLLGGKGRAGADIGDIFISLWDC